MAWFCVSVSDQAIRALCPIKIPGRPGTLTPATSKPGADRATSYQTDGIVCGRCGSPASSAPPPCTAGPLAAHALLSGYWCRWLAGSRLSLDAALRNLMRAHYALGQRGLAIRAYLRNTKQLDQEFGVRPGE